jgi:hypothetical protein
VLTTSHINAAQLIQARVQPWTGSRHRQKQAWQVLCAAAPPSNIQPCQSTLVAALHKGFRWAGCSTSQMDQFKFNIMCDDDAAYNQIDSPSKAL